MSNVTQSGAVVIDTPEGIEMVRLLSFRSAMGLEIKTGMKLSRGRSAFRLAKEQGLTTTTSKRKAYGEIDALVVQGGMDSKPLPPAAPKA